MAIAFGLVLTLSLPPVSFGASDKKEIEEEKSEIRKAVKETLTELYKVAPSAKKATSKSAGYAVFNNFGMKIFFAGSGTGKGIVFDNKTKKQTLIIKTWISSSTRGGKWVLRHRQPLNMMIRAMLLPERCRCLPEFGCTRLPTTGWRWSSLSKEPSTTKMMISIDLLAVKGM